jgi:hypothetical protein
MKDPSIQPPAIPSKRMLQFLFFPMRVPKIAANEIATVRVRITPNELLIHPSIAAEIQMTLKVPKPVNILITCEKYLVPARAINAPLKKSIAPENHAFLSSQPLT